MCMQIFALQTASISAKRPAVHVDQLTESAFSRRANLRACRRVSLKADKGFVTRPSAAWETNGGLF